MVDGCPNANGDALAAPAGAALEGAALPPKEKVVPVVAAGLAAPKGLLAASPNVTVEVDEGVVVVVAPNEGVADPAAAAAAFGCPKLKFEVDAGAAVPKVAAVVVAAVATPAALVLLALDPNENEGAPPPPKEKAGAAAAEAVAAVVVVAAVFPKENEGVSFAVVEAVAAATVPSFPEPKEKPPPPVDAVFPKVNAEPDVAGAAAAAAEVDVVVAADAKGVPNEKFVAADVKSLFAAVVVLACPKLKEGAAGVRLEVVAAWGALLVLLPKENVGVVEVMLAVVFALSEASVELNEKLAVSAAGATPSDVVFPKVNAEPVVAGAAAVEVVVVAADADGVPNERVGIADVEVVLAAVVVFACPKLKEGAVRVGPEVVAAWAALFELLPKENDGVVVVVVPVVFALSEAAVDPNEKLFAGAAGASDLPKENAGSEGAEVVEVAAALLSDPDAEKRGAAAAAAEADFFLSSSLFSLSSDFFSTPKFIIAAFAFSGLFLPSSSFSALEVLSPKENVTFGGEEAADGALFESEAESFEASAGLSSAGALAPSVTSFFFLPPSSSLFSSCFLSSTSAAGGPRMTSLSSKVESKSATLFPMRLLSAS